VGFGGSFGGSFVHANSISLIYFFLLWCIPNISIGNFLFKLEPILLLLSLLYTKAQVPIEKKLNHRTEPPKS
jgi:hypothetical protein